jgi:hypothetical protein
MALNLSSLSNASSTSSTRKEGKCFINVGFKCNINGESEVVYLPFGIDLDNLPELKVTGSNEYQARTILRNELVSQIRQLIMSMEPGTAKISEDAVVEFRRKNETMTVDTNNMPKFELKVKELD